MKKLKMNGTVKWVAIAAGLLAAVTTAIIGYGRMQERLANNCRSDDEYHPQITECKQSITRIEANYEAIQRDISRQSAMQEKMLNKQDQIIEMIWMSQ